jgi:hypothetical protein
MLYFSLTFFFSTTIPLLHINRMFLPVFDDGYSNEKMEIFLLMFSFVFVRFLMVIIFLFLKIFFV